MADAQSRLRLLENTAKFVFIKIRGHLRVYTPGGGAGQRGDPGARGQASAAPPKSKPALRPLTRAPWPRSAMVRAAIRILHLAWIAPRATFGTPGSVPLRSSRICSRAAMPRYNGRNNSPPEPAGSTAGSTAGGTPGSTHRSHAPEAPPEAPPGARAGSTAGSTRRHHNPASKMDAATGLESSTLLTYSAPGCDPGCDPGSDPGSDPGCDTGV